MQEFYFSGTIERIIFENASNFFRILLLEIDETDSDFEDYEIIVTGTMGEVMEGRLYLLGSANQSPQIWQTTPNDSLRAFKTLCQWPYQIFLQ